MENVPRNESIIVLELKNTSWSNAATSQDYLPSKEQFLDEVKLMLKILVYLSLLFFCRDRSIKAENRYFRKYSS